MSSNGDDSARIPEELLLPTLGALTFASGEPVFPREIAEAFAELPEARIEEGFEQLERELERSGTGLCLERVAGGYRLATRSEVGALMRRFFRQRHRARLSPAALETLAIVAYRQPITAPEIQAIRGKDPTAALRSLLDKRLLRLMGKKKVVGSPLLYGTSKQFLDHFGLNSLADLPAIQDFEEFVGALAEAQGGIEAEGDVDDGEGALASAGPAAGAPPPAD